MKKTIFVLILFLALPNCFSQNVFPTASGTNVGIGTSSPGARLEVVSPTTGTSGVKLTNLPSTTFTSTSSNKSLSVDIWGNVVLTNTDPMSVSYLSSYPSIDDAITDLNSNASISTLIIDATSTLGISKTINQYKSIKFLNGHPIRIPNGVTLTINGTIEAGIFQIFNCIGTGITNGHPVIDQAYPQWWQTPSDNPTLSWTNSIQRAVNFYPRVYFPSREQYHGYLVDETIYLDLSLHETASYQLYGSGRGSYFETGNPTTFTGFVFETINIPVYGFNSGLTFDNLYFFCDQGINILGGAVSEAWTGEEYPIQRVRITNCFFFGKSVATDNYFTGIAISLKKTFDSEISNNHITNFNIGIKLMGSDINSIHDNRITDFYRHAICDFAFRTFGSQNAIVHNDLLSYLGKDTPDKEVTGFDNTSFIKSTSNHILIKDNYLENPKNGKRMFAYIDCSKVGLTVDEMYTGENFYFTKFMDITGNRCDVDGERAKWIYYLNENFKSINLVELPNINETFTKSTFCVDETKEHPTDKINLKITSTQNTWDKVMHMTNCESFTDWDNNFSTSKLLSNGTYGELIINSKNISATSQRGEYNMQKFNSKSFFLDENESLFIQINAKSKEGVVEDFFRGGATVYIKVRNYRKKYSDPNITGTDGLYFAIKTSLVAMPAPTYQIGNIDIPDSEDGYSIIRFEVPASEFAHYFEYYPTNHNIYFQLYSRKGTLEFKEISIYGTEMIRATKDSWLKDKAKSEDPKELERNDSESTQTLIVKVDNELTTHPNPAKTNLTIDIKKGDILKSIEIYTETGSFIGDYTNKMNNNVIDISSLPNATYLVKVTSIASTSKIIIKE